MLQRQSEKYWWFGINNKERRHSNEHMLFRPDFEKFLKGFDKSIDWKRNPSRFKNRYNKIVEGDSVLFWMGRPGDFQKWGIMGFAYVEKVFTELLPGNKLDQYKFRLKTIYTPSIPITPQINNFSERTNITDFLVKTFGLNFGPLNKLFNRIDFYRDQRIKPASKAITIEEINSDIFNACLEYAKNINNDY